MAVGGSPDSGDTESSDVHRILAALDNPDELWQELVRGVGPVLNQRHVAALAHRVAELLELTEVAANIHPTRRPLQGFLASCPGIEGLWELDIESLLMRLDDVSLWAPALLVPSREEGRPAALTTFVHLFLPPSAEALDGIAVSVLERDGTRSDEHDLPISLPVLAGATYDHLVSSIPTATVLARSARGFLRPAIDPPDANADTDVDAGRAADRLIEMFAAYEDLLARRAAKRRGPDGSFALDSEVDRQQSVIFDHSYKTKAVVRHSLPENTLEPISLRIDAHTGPDPNGHDQFPTAYTLELDISEDHRGAGRIRVANWEGTAERAVHLPHLTHTWLDHIESAILRCEIVTRGIQRTPAEELTNPVEAVLAPIAESYGKSVILNDIPF